MDKDEKVYKLVEFSNIPEGGRVRIIGVACRAAHECLLGLMFTLKNGNLENDDYIIEKSYLPCYFYQLHPSAPDGEDPVQNEISSVKVVVTKYDLPAGRALKLKGPLKIMTEEILND